MTEEIKKPEAAPEAKKPKPKRTRPTWDDNGNPGAVSRDDKESER